MIVVILPAPPPLNNLFRNVPGKGRVRTDRYKTWAQSAGWALNMARAEPIVGDVAAEIVIEKKPSGKRADLDNLAKAPLDLLVRHGLIEDDSRVVDLRIRYGEVVGCVVTISAA